MTAETAVLLPVLVVLLAVAVWVLAALGTQLRAVEAARAGARAVARGEGSAQVAARVREVLGGRTEVTVRRVGEDVVVEVRHTRTPPPPLLSRLLPDLTISARAVTAAEPGPVAT